MSINNVNQNTDIQKLLKLMKTNKSGKTAMSSKVPAHMTMNGSIFNANANTVSSVGGNKSAAATRGTQSAQTTNGVVQANTAKSVSNVSNTQSSQSARETQGKEEDSRINLSNYDFDNLTGVTDTELNSLKAELTDLKDSNIPRFLENSVDKKLSKVKSEMQKRASGTTGTEQNGAADQTKKKDDPTQQDGEPANAA